MPPTPQGHQGPIGIPTGGPGGAQGFSSFGFFWGKPFFGPGSGGKGLAHMCPNPLGFISPFLFAKPSIGEPFLVENHLFPGPIFAPKRSPAQPAHPGDQILDPGVQKSSPNPKYKICMPKKTCRIQCSEFQAEAYGASYGPKPFLSPTTKKCG